MKRLVEVIVWPMMFLLATISILWGITYPGIFDEFGQNNKKKNTERAVLISKYSASLISRSKSLNTSVSALKGRDMKWEMRDSKLKIAIVGKSNEILVKSCNSNNRHDKQFVKSSSAFCPGAYEHAL